MYIVLAVSHIFRFEKASPYYNSPFMSYTKLKSQYKAKSLYMLEPYFILLRIASTEIRQSDT